jgi:hypothetical protein
VVAAGRQGRQQPAGQQRRRREANTRPGGGLAEAGELCAAVLRLLNAAGEVLQWLDCRCTTAGGLGFAPFASTQPRPPRTHVKTARLVVPRPSNDPAPGPLPSALPSRPAAFAALVHLRHSSRTRSCRGAATQSSHLRLHARPDLSAHAGP